MLDIINEVRAEAQREIVLAKAKIEVADAIEAKFLSKQSECEATKCEETQDFGETEDVAVETETFCNI